MINHGELHATITPRGILNASINPRGQINVELRKNEGGTNDYNRLVNHPSINTHELIGDKNGNELGLINSDDTLGLQEIDRMFAAVFGL